MRTTKLAILALISFIPLLLSGCGSSRDSGGDQTVGLTPTATIAAASFVGSTQCLSCHSNKSNWGHTLHKAVLRAPNAFSPAQAATETFYAGTVNKGIKLSLGTAGGGIDNDVTPDLTPDGEFVAYYYSTLDNKWKTHYELGQGAAANTGALTTPSGNYALKYSAQIVKSGTEYFVQFTNLAGAGTAQYKILFSYGGEKNYKQRYVLADDNNNTGKLLGASKHISPLQYNDKWSGYVDPTSTATPDLNYKWVNYHGERWYNLTDSALTSPGSKDSFDGNCAGCHFTGYQIALNGAGEEIADAVDDINGAVDFDGDGSMDEINIGCEACHGAGSAHASTQNPAYIINPANLAPAAANMVCGQCHIRGKSVDAFAEFAEATSIAPAKAPFPAKLDADGKLMKFRPGLDDLATFYSFDTGTGGLDGQYWGGEPSSGNYQASSSHHQQYIDMLQGPHAPDKSFDPKCFDCHDMHNNASTGRHQVVTTITEDNVVVKTANDDNSLCLTCHAGFGPFATLTVEDVAQINPNSAFNDLMDPVKKAVTDHTQHYYDPAKQDSLSNGSSRCSRCHMPKTAKSALKYDIHAHSFEVIEPAASKTTSASVGVPNGCTGCHTAADDTALDVLQAEFDAKFPKGTDGHLDVTLRDTTMEFLDWESTGHGDYAADPFNHWNEDGEVSSSCARCHSKDGFVDYITNGSITQLAKLGTTISCGVCHVNGDSPALRTDQTLRTVGQVTAPYTGASVVYPDVASSNICLNCHTGRESGESIKVSTADFTNKSFINSHYLTAGGTVFAQTGYTYTGPGRDYTIPAGDTHVLIGTGTTGVTGVDTYTDGPCITCHFSSDDGSHSLSPFTQYAVGDLALNPVCVFCHGSRGAGSNAAIAWLGDDTTAATLQGSTHKARYQAALEAMNVQLNLSGYSFLGHYPYFATKDWTSTADVTGKLNMGAAFNYNLMIHDPGGVAHNRRYTRRLIYDSIDWLDNGALDFSVAATLNALADATVYKASAISYLLKAQLGDAGDRY